MSRRKGEEMRRRKGEGEDGKEARKEEKEEKQVKK